MTVSKKVCRENLKLIFAMLRSENIDSITKTNIIISLGDLMHRYPNITEPYTHKLYENLRDKDVNVRKTTLMVITHLILNGMLKLKSEICDVALLLQDEELRIRNLVKLFFHELHKKDPNIIYNLLPEAISRMSIQEYNIDESTFHSFVKNIQ